MNLLTLSRYGRQGASSRYRTLQYLSYWEQAGIVPDVVPLLDDIYLNNLYTNRSRNVLAIAKTYWHRTKQLLRQRHDLIWIEKEAFPWLPTLLEQPLLRQGTPYVVDYDDALFHRYDQHRVGMVRWCLGNKIDKVMQHAALVIAGNEYLAERAQEAGARRIEIVPTVVDLARYAASPPSNKSAFTVGWIGSPTTTSYLEALLPVLQRLAQEGPVKLIAIGASPFGAPGIDLEIVPWSEDTEVTHLERCDVGVMPLSDSAWERGKCGLKLIQYMACARPVVGSPVGVNKQLIHNGVIGFQATTDADWLTALRTLRDDPVLRRRQGLAGRAKVEGEYSLQITGPRLASLLLEVAQVPPSISSRGAYIPAE
jgi:glycosyltransferase involved in cell wall biosynthesis